MIFLVLIHVRFDKSVYTEGYVHSTKPPEEVANWNANIPQVELRFCDNLPDFKLPRGGPPIALCHIITGYLYTTFTT